MLSKTKELVRDAKAKGVKIIHSPILFTDDYRELRRSGTDFGILANVQGGGCFKASEWGGAFCEDVNPASDEIIIQGKRGLCAFASTNLDFVLRQNQIDTIVLAGFLTNCCVESKFLCKV